MRPKNKVLQISDVSVPWSHSRNSLLTHMGSGFYMLFPDRCQEQACVNMQEAQESWGLRLKHGSRKEPSLPT